MAYKVRLTGPAEADAYVAFERIRHGAKDRLRAEDIEDTLLPPEA